MTAGPPERGNAAGRGPGTPPADADRTPARHLAERVVVVLVQPQMPGNVGATARAMANFGLSRLVIVDPPPSFDPEEARWMAPGAHGVIAGALLTATLDEALEDVQRVVATTARHRKHHQPVDEPPAFAEAVLDDPGTTAILFGREDFGLANEHAQRAERLVRIPTAEHASLNLAQAVLLVGHHLFEAARTRGLDAPGRLTQTRRGERSAADLAPPAHPAASVAALEPLVDEAVALFERLGLTRGTAVERYAVSVRGGLQRAGLRPGQVGALRGVVRRMQYALDHPGVDLTLGRSAKSDD